MNINYTEQANIDINYNFNRTKQQMADLKTFIRDISNTYNLGHFCKWQDLGQEYNIHEDGLIYPNLKMRESKGWAVSYIVNEDTNEVIIVRALRNAMVKESIIHNSDTHLIKESQLRSLIKRMIREELYKRKMMV